MANKRQKKKNLKKLQQQQTLKRKKNIKSVSRETSKRKSIVSRETSKYNSKSKSSKYQDQLKLTSKKYFALLELGIDPKFLTTQNLRKVKVKDFPKGALNKKGTKQGNINKITYPFLFEDNKVTKEVKKKVKNIGEKVYKLPEGIGLYFAYMDISGEQDFEQLLARYNRKSTNDLIEKIKGLLNTLPQFDKELYKKSKGSEGTSSGKCGVANFHLAPIDTIKSISSYITHIQHRNIGFHNVKDRTVDKPVYTIHMVCDNLDQAKKEILLLNNNIKVSNELGESMLLDTFNPEEL